MNTSQFDTLFIIRAIRHYWKIISIVFVVSAIAGVVFSSSMFLTPLYKTKSVLYPSNLIPYSQESETEQMLQFFQSNVIRDSVIIKFDLFSHYGINANDKFGKYRIYEEFNDHVSIKRSEYESVIIDVYDKDPMMSYEINREMINQYNLKVRQTQRDKAAELMVVQQDLMVVSKVHIDSIGNRLKELSQEYKILDFETQVKEAYRGFFSSNAANRTQLDQLISNLELHGGEYNLLAIQLEQFSAAYASAVTEYEKARIDVEKILTYSSEIISPYPPDRKAWPVRWLIVLVSVAASTLLCFVFIGFYEQLKKFRINEPSEKQ